jgi:hypothetical protein
MLNKKSFINGIVAAFVIYITILVTGCSNSHNTPDTSAIDIKLNVSRFERDLFGINTGDINAGVLKLQKKYGNFFNLFAFQIMTIGSKDTALMNEHLKSFISDSNFRAIYNDVEKLFGNFSKESEALTNALKNYSYYFPGKVIPSIVTMISGFSYPVVCDSLNLGISLDMYLGPSYKYYSTLEPPLPNYLRTRMHRNYLVSDAMKGWIQSDYGIDESSARMIDFMISNGRILYFLDKVLPDTEDSIKTGYTKKQLDWCNANEKSIWSFFIDNKLLFSIDPNLMNKYVNDGPTTNGFPKDSPGNIGQFIGWRIVKSYMQVHPDLTLKQLMEEKDLVRIFNESKYKPR